MLSTVISLTDGTTEKTKVIYVCVIDFYSLLVIIKTWIHQIFGGVQIGN